MSALPAPLQAFVKGIAPMRVVSTAAPVIAGVATAEIGGAVLKMASHQVEDFASSGNPQDALVHVAGGTVLNGLATAGYYVATKDGAGAGKIAALMSVGTVVASVRPLIAPAIAKTVDHATSFVAGLLKKSAPQSPSDAQAGATPKGLADFNPGGMEDFMSPGGMEDLYANASSW